MTLPKSTPGTQRAHEEGFALAALARLATAAVFYRRLLVEVVDTADREPKLPVHELLELAECVAVVAEKTPVVAEGQHAHDIESDRAIAGVEVLGEVGCRQSL